MGSFRSPYGLRYGSELCGPRRVWRHDGSLAPSPASTRRLAQRGIVIPFPSLRKSPLQVLSELVVTAGDVTVSAGYRFFHAGPAAIHRAESVILRFLARRKAASAALSLTAAYGIYAMSVEPTFTYNAAYALAMCFLAGLGVTRR